MGQYTIYKPYQETKGSALKLEFRENDNKKNPYLLFLQMVRQIGVEGENAKFGWGDKSQTIIFKLSDVDVGKMLRVLDCKVDEVSSYHEFGNKKTALRITKGDKGFYFRLSRSKDDYINIGVTYDEAECLILLLKSAFVRKYSMS